MRLGRTIIKRSGPFVAGYFQTSIVAFEIAVMHLVMKGSERKPHLAPNRNSFITGMCGGSRQGVVLQIINDQVFGKWQPSADEPLKDRFRTEGLAEQGRNPYRGFRMIVPLLFLRLCSCRRLGSVG